MELGHKLKFSIYSTEQSPVQIEFAPAFISGMSNPELLRFGVHAKLRCSQAENPNDPWVKTLLVHLNHARAEWNRRHPKLPLRDSF